MFEITFKTINVIKNFSCECNLFRQLVEFRGQVGFYAYEHENISMFEEHMKSLGSKLQTSLGYRLFGLHRQD